MQEKKKRGLPVIDSTEMPESLDCTTCLLPMQYQKKIEDKFVWQCFRCGKKYFVHTENGKPSLKKHGDRQDNFMYSEISSKA